MNYDSIILELLTRIYTLEQQVKKLTEKVEGNAASARLTYDDLVENFARNPRDVQTVPYSKDRTPLWFFVLAEKGFIYVQAGRSHDPYNSKIFNSRLLDPKEYDAVLALYQRRKAGENISNEMKVTTQNSSYWFGIFAELNL